MADELNVTKLDLILCYLKMEELINWIVKILFQRRKYQRRMRRNDDLSFEFLPQNARYVEKGRQHNPLPLGMKVSFHLVNQNHHAVLGCFLRETGKDFVLVPRPHKQIR